MTTTRGDDEILIVDPDPRVRRAIADLVNSTDGLTVAAACATFDEATRSGAVRNASAALVSVRDPDAAFDAVTLLAREVPVVAVACVRSAAARASASGAAAFYDEDGDADALIAVIRDVIAPARS